MSAPAFLAPFAAAFVAIALASACGVGLAGRIALRRPPPVQRSTSLWAAILLAPAILGALGCAALASPDPFAGCHCTAHGLHHPHLCTSHPGLALSLVVPALCLLGAWLSFSGPRLFRLGRELYASARWVRGMRRAPALMLDGVAIRLADCRSRSAFMVGSLSPVIVFDRLLWRSLSDEARLAVAYHEQGHVRRRDGLTLLALRLCAALFPIPGASRLLVAWRAAAESTCDRHAAVKLGDAAAVAAALVTVERIRAESSPEDAAIPAAALGIGAGGDIERRVLALLDVGGRPARPWLENDLLVTSIGALGALAITIAWPGDSFHHAIETLIGSLIF
jgi:Peptidase family M48